MSVNNTRPPSGRKSKRSTQLANKEQEFKDLNAELEEKTASLINEVESVLRGQDSLFSTLDTDSTSISQDMYSAYLTTDANTLLENINNSEPPTKDNQESNHARKIKPKNNLTKTQKKKIPGGQVRPMTTSSINTKKKTNENNKQRSQSSKGFRGINSTDLIEERATLVDRINTLELEASDDVYEVTDINENTLPQVDNDMGPDAIIRFLKAKLHVMQEELDAMVVDLREKNNTISKLEIDMKEKEENEVILNKKIEQLQSTIEKHKSNQNDLRLKNTNLESDITSLKKDLESRKRENKQTVSSKNTLEVRLNRALEEVEKYKSALQKSKESSKVSNDFDKKRVEQLQNENKKLEKQKSELMTAFKKQLKLIDILKRQKMHLEAAKVLEFTEEEFVRALDWGK